MENLLTFGWKIGSGRTLWAAILGFFNVVEMPDGPMVCVEWHKESRQRCSWRLGTWRGSPLLCRRRCRWSDERRYVSAAPVNSKARTGRGCTVPPTTPPACLLHASFCYITFQANIRENLTSCSTWVAGAAVVSIFFSGVSRKYSHGKFMGNKISQIVALES